MRYRANRKAKIKPEFIHLSKNVVDDSGVFNSSFWERTKTLEDQGAVIRRPLKRGSCFLSKSLLESTDNNSNTVNTTLTVFFPCNTPLCPNFDIDVSLLNEEIDSLEIFFDTQFQNLRQTSSVKSNDKGKNRNNESNISIEPFQNKICISKKEFINKKN